MLGSGAGRVSGAVTLLFVLLLTSCSSGGAQESSGPAAEGGRGPGRGSGAATPVMTATVVERVMPITMQTVGTVEAASTVEVRSQISGEVLSVEFNEGQDVTAGAPLFTLDPRPLELALRQAEATLAKDSAQSKNAEAQRNRYRNLLAGGLISQADFDAVSAQANALQASLTADAVQIDNARLQLQYTKITAPVSGRTGALLVHKGALVRTGDASPMVVINQLEPVSVSFAVPARGLHELQTDHARDRLRVEAVVPGGTGAAAVGAVTFIDNAVDATSDTIRLKGSFANRDRRLWPGQFVQVMLQLSVDLHAIVVPGAAVQPSQQGTFVYVVKSDHTVEARPVTVSRTEGADAVIATGLRPGEVVVTDGQIGLTPGARVLIKAPIAAPK